MQILTRNSFEIKTVVLRVAAMEGSGGKRKGKQSKGKEKEMVERKFRNDEKDKALEDVKAWLRRRNAVIYREGDSNPQKSIV